MRKRSGLLVALFGGAFLLFLAFILWPVQADRHASSPADMKVAERPISLEQEPATLEAQNAANTVVEAPQPTPDPGEASPEGAEREVDTPVAPEKKKKELAETAAEKPHGRTKGPGRRQARDVDALLETSGGKEPKVVGMLDSLESVKTPKENRRPKRKNRRKPPERRILPKSPDAPDDKIIIDGDGVSTNRVGAKKDANSGGFMPELEDTRDEVKQVIDLLGDLERPAQPPAKPKARTSMTETSVDPKSTFAIDVDTGSYTLARARMREGYPPRKGDVRIEEFVNYFHYDYPEPVQGEFAVALEAARDPMSTSPRRHLVRIGVQGKSVPTDDRPPAHLTFLVDVSGSMFGPDQLGLVIEALDLVTRNLRPEDTIAVVTFATDADVKMWPAGATERDIISRTIATLEPGGSSSLDKGLDLAYEVASTHYVAGHINRVVLLGDGRVNAGETRPRKLLESVRYGVEDGVELSTIGFGAKSFNDHMMEQLADRGNGAYYFVDSYREAQKVFGDHLCGTLLTIAKDVKIQVEFNPKSVLRHRLLGYENRELKHREFRDDSVDAGEIGAGHAVTAIYEVDLADELDETIAMVNVRYKKPDESVASELNFQLFTEELVADVRRASADFKFAAAVAMYAEIARGTLPADEGRMSLLREIAGEGTPNPEKQPDRAEFLALVDETAAFFIN